MSLEKKPLVAFANKERDRFETALRQFVDIPTVSADADRLPDPVEESGVMGCCLILGHCLGALIWRGELLRARLV